MPKCGKPSCRTGRDSVQGFTSAMLPQVAALIKGNVLSAVVDATGSFLTPGLVDIHCHVRRPGAPHAHLLA